MSKKTLGFIPKSGEKMLKDAIGQFKGIISQIEEGSKKVIVKTVANAKKIAKLEAENTRQEAAVAEARIVQANLKAMITGKIVALPVVEEVKETVEETETPEKEEAVVDDEEPPEDTTSKESNS
jgi:hypothetical protein